MIKLKIILITMLFCVYGLSESSEIIIQSIDMGPWNNEDNYTFVSKTNDHMFEVKANAEFRLKYKLYNFNFNLKDKEYYLVTKVHYILKDDKLYVYYEKSNSDASVAELFCYELNGKSSKIKWKRFIGAGLTTGVYLKNQIIYYVNSFGTGALSASNGKDIWNISYLNKKSIYNEEMFYKIDKYVIENSNIIYYSSENQASGEYMVLFTLDEKTGAVCK